MDDLSGWLSRYMDIALGKDPVSELESRTAVVIACDHEDRDIPCIELRQEIVKKIHGFRTGIDSVVDITRDQDRIRIFLVALFKKLIDPVTLVINKRHSVDALA